MATSNPDIRERAVPHEASWLAHYEPGVPHVLDPAAGDFAGILADAAAVAPTFPAVTDGRRALHYAALNASADAVAAALGREPAADGRPIVVALPPGPTLLAVVLGTLRAGRIVAPVDGADASAAAELSDRLGAPLAIVLDREALPFAQAMQRTGGPLPRIITVDPLRELRFGLRWLARLGAGKRTHRPVAAVPDAVPWQRWVAGDGQASPTGDEAVRTGAIEVDGVRYGMPVLAAGAQMMTAWLTDTSPGDDTWLVLAPLATPLGVVAALGAAPALRARVALPGSWQPADAVDALRYFRPAWVVSDVATVARLVAAPELPHAELRSVRGWLVGGPVPPMLARAFVETTGVELCVGWAPRGVAGFVACHPVNGWRGIGGVGLPLPGVTAAAGPGGLVLRAANVVGGAIVEPGARLDADGFLQVDHGPDEAMAVFDRFRQHPDRVTGPARRR